MKSVDDLQKDVDFPKIVEHLCYLVHNNLHTEAFIAASEYFGFQDLVEAFEKIYSEQAYFGYLTDDLLANRYIEKISLPKRIESCRGAEV